jgi:phospholipase C
MSVHDRRLSLSRRHFILTTSLAASGLVLGCSDQVGRVLGPSIDPLSKSLPAPDQSGVDHIVVVMMENRSFDHMAGWLSGADGRQSGLSYTDADGTRHKTHALAPDFQGCGHPDPDHSFEGGRVEYNNGACDGWLRAGSNDEYAIGYYRRQDLAFLGHALSDWVSFDRYFAAMMGPTLPNRIYQHAAQTDRLESIPLPLSTLPTIWDRLATANVPGRYYFSDVPTLALWGDKYSGISRRIEQFFIEAAAGQLPAVAFVDPQFLGEEAGVSNDDHPHADIRAGERFLSQIYSAVSGGPSWRNTVLIVTYDEWGGFFDHVPPPAGSVTSAERALGYTDGLRGFRIPVMLASPMARRGEIAHTVFDHTSILKLIEWRWSLDPLTDRDAQANNLATVLNFKSQDLSAPQYSVPDISSSPCSIAAPQVEEDLWGSLLQVARANGWQV